MKKCVAVLLLALAAVFARAGPGWCGGDVTIKTRPGLAGIYKVTCPVLIRVDIDNRGDGFRGLLTVVPRDREPVRRSGPVYMTEVEVPAGGRVTLDLVVPGELASGSPLVRLAAGGITLAETGLEGVGLGGGAVVLSLGERLSGSSLFAWLDKTHGGQVTVKYLPPEDLPEKSLFLGAADVIVADREAAARLSSGQVDALKEWVRLGGTLLLSGEDGTVSGGPFRDIGPAAGGSPGTPARRPLGRGEVVLFRAPIESVEDRGGKTWEALGLLPKEKRLFGDRAMEMKHVLADAGSYFPLVKTPGIPVITLLWAAYALAVGPGLYLTLKRLNRRDLAWVLVPAAAVLAALGCYTLSPANGRQAYLAHTTATVEIVDENLAEVRASGTFVLPRGGSLEVAGGEMLLDPVNFYSGRRGRPAAAYSDGRQSRVVFEGVEYGSMRQVHSYGTLSGVGRVAGRVFFRDDRLTGEIVNRTALDLRDCRILVGKNLMEIGHIPAGGSRRLDEPLNWSVIVDDPGSMYRVDSQSPVKVREARLISSFTARRESAGEVYFLGWSDSAPDYLKVIRPEGQGQSSGLTLVRQKIELDFPAGPFRLPAGFIRYTVRNPAGGYGTGPGAVVIHRGSVQISYDLPKTLNTGSFRVTGIEVPAVPDRAFYTVEIYRQDTQGWDQVDKNGQRYTGADALKYLSGEGKIEVRLTSPVEKGEGIFPGITVEGVVGG